MPFTDINTVAAMAAAMHRMFQNAPLLPQQHDSPAKIASEFIHFQRY